MTAGDPSAQTLRLPPRGLLGDDRLARLACRGDRRAFEAIFRRYQQELYHFCRAILADPHEAHDALQSTMEAALRALPDDERRIALRPWLFRVAHNEAISILRRRTALVDPAALPESSVPGADPQAEQRERLRQLIVDLDALPERQRGALVMRELNGLAYSEIGDSLGASEGAARQIVYEARLALRDEAHGREMECDAVRGRLSKRDGRVLRGRRVRAHLRSCEPCRDFRAAISQRRADLRALCPPLAAGPALLGALLQKAGKAGVEAAAPSAAGAGSTGGGAVGTGVGLATSSIGSSAALKATSIAATVAIGAGAAGFTGKVDLPLGISSDDPATAGSAKPGATPAAPAAGSARSTAHGRSDIAPNPTAGPKRHAATAGRGPHSSSGNGRATGHGSPPAQAHGPNAASPSVATSPGPPEWAGGKGSSNGAAAAGGGPPASSPHSGSRPGLSRAPSHAPGPPGHAQGSPGSPPPQAKAPPAHGQGPPPLAQAPPPLAQVPPAHAQGPPAGQGPPN
jgi:RNA polymerase sigma factor (sigma-70 family)